MQGLTELQEAYDVYQRDPQQASLVMLLAQVRDTLSRNRVDPIWGKNKQ